MVSGLIGLLFTLVFLGVGYKLRVRSLTAKENALLSEPPKECPKCGHSRASQGQHAMPRPIFMRPHYRERSVVSNTPEHLSYSCGKCMFDVQRSAGKELNA